MNIHIEFIPSKQQRYNTLGDWFFDADGNLIIRVSNDDQMAKSEDSQLLIALHELVEVLLCRKRGITQEMVDKFDMDKQEYCNENGYEPGDMEDAPYRKEHRSAMLIEHMVAHEMGIAGYGVIK